MFPELSLTGYELDLAESLAFSPSDRRLAPLAALASEHAMTIVVGAPLRIETRLHLGAFILAPDGTSAIYTNHHLGAFPSSASPDGIVPPAEASIFQAGDHNPLVRIGAHTAAVAICADTGRPSHPRAAAERGAGAYLASMFVIPEDLAHDTDNLRTYAARHAMAVVFANYGGPSGGLPAAGRSAIWSERGELLDSARRARRRHRHCHRSPSGWRASAIMFGDRWRATYVLASAQRFFTARASATNSRHESGIRCTCDGRDKWAAKTAKGAKSNGRLHFAPFAVLAANMSLRQSIAANFKLHDTSGR